MASVFKKHGNWYLRYRDSHGRWRRRVSEARTKTEARRLADDLERRCERQRLGFEPLPPEDGGGTVGELLEWWLENRSKFTVTHKRNELTIRKRLLGSTLAPLKITQLTPGDVEQYLREQSIELAPQSLAHLRMYLSRSFSAAIEAGKFIGTNPISKVKRPRIPKRPPDYLAAEEVPLVLAALSNEHRPLFATAIYTGLRKGELFGLLKSDVSLKARLLTVGHSHGRNVTKSGHAHSIPIASELIPYLEVAIAQSPSELVFPNAQGGRRREDTKLVRILRGAMGRAGIVIGYEHVCRRCRHKDQHPDAALRHCPECQMKLWPKPQVRPLRFHDLRHTTASLMMMAGANPAAVQRIMRHSDPRITTEVYGHLSPEYLHSEVDRLRFNPEGAEPEATVKEQSSAAAIGAMCNPFSPVVSPYIDLEEFPHRVDPKKLAILASSNGRGDTIRTCDPLLPKQVL